MTQGLDSATLRRDIVAAMGFFPPFFEPAMAAPDILDELWRQTRTVYLGGPLPMLFKEKLAALLGRYCHVPYCLICHSAALRPLGMRGAEVLALLEAAPEPADALQRRLEGLGDAPLAAFPEAGSAAEQCLLGCAVAIFLGEAGDACQPRLRRLLGEATFAHLGMFIAYNRTCLAWAEAHPELAHGDDARAQQHLGPLLREAPRLAAFFADYPAVVRLQAQRRRRWLGHENRRLAQASTAHERRFRQLTDAIPQLVWTVDPGGSCTYVNHGYLDYVGGDAAEAARPCWDDDVHPDDRARRAASWEAARAAHHPYEAEYRLRRHDGAYHWFLARGLPLRDAAGEVVEWLGTCTDIEAQRQVAEALRHERDNRERFVATLTHDLRAPLAAAKIEIQRLQRRPGAVQAPGLAAAAVRHLDRANQMIEDLLDSSRLRFGERLPLRLARTDLTALLDHTVADLQAIYGHRCVLRCAPAPLPCTCDPHAVRRVVENLVTNAVKYGLDGGPVRVGLTAQGAIAVLEVHNVGPPLDPATRGKLFDMYARGSHGGQRGWGLGLPLVHGVVTAHDGEVEVDSRAGHGTTFRVSLPLHGPRPDATR